MLASPCRHHRRADGADSSTARATSTHSLFLALLLAILLVTLCGPAALAQPAPKAGEAAGTASEMAAMAMPDAAALPLSVQPRLYRVRSANWPDKDIEASLLLVVRLSTLDGHYIYGHEPGPLGLPTNVIVTDADGNEFPVYYPPPRRKPDAFDPSQVVAVYLDTTRIFVPLPGVGGPDVNLNINASGLLCSTTTCMPFDVNIPFSASLEDPGALPTLSEQPWSENFRKAAQAEATVREGSSPGAMQTGEVPPYAELFSPQPFQPGLEVTGLAKAALLAILAGLILNFMPCVLPVVSLKLKGLLTGCCAESRSNPVRCFRTYNLAFAAGILSYFLVLAVALSAMDIAWGQLFQQPIFIMLLLVLVFALALSLFGVFDLPVVDLKNPSQGASHSAANAYFTGVLATLLATPCSGPFLGGVLAWALIQPPIVVATVFFCIGLGMALPYLVMAARPAILTPFQRPGGWTLYVERIGAFFLAATCVYLVQILPERLVTPALVVLLVTAFAAWMWGNWVNLSHSLTRRLTVRLLAAALVAAAVMWALAPPKPAPRWKPFEPEAFARAVGHKPLLVDFTADWCPNCKFLELTVLTDENLARWQDDYGLGFVQVDLTEPDPATQALLEAMGSKSIPVVAIIPADDPGHPVVLRDVFRQSTLEAALKASLARE